MKTLIYAFFTFLIAYMTNLNATIIDNICSSNELMINVSTPFPDSIYVDSTAEIGDTIAIFTSGWDTTFVVYHEEIPDSLAEELWVINDPNKQMIVTLSFKDAAVNEGVIGINLTDFFEEDKAQFEDNDNYDVVPDPWQAISDLAPKTIRVFSGASAKFMHPLGSYSDYDEFSYGGYGYNWTEMVDYFDATNPTALIGGLAGAYADLDGGCIGTDCDWMDESLIDRALDFFDKCASQPTYDPTLLVEPGEQPLYINDLIQLVHKIQDDNPGLTVDVIYCVNIESMSASEMLDVIDYLRDNEINVVGIELGNEVANDFGALAMGFIDFDHYWEYINGGNYDGAEETALLAALRDDMENDHNFIEVIKANLDYYQIKIGLPAFNTPNCGGKYDFALMPHPDDLPHDYTGNYPAGPPVITDPDPEIDDEDCDCNYPDWNIALADHYDEVTTITTHEHYSFDAIIFHTYYTPTNNAGDCDINSNWFNIMADLHPPFDPSHILDYDYNPIDFSTISPYGAWDYTPSVDPRLSLTFNRITGIGSSIMPGNFKEFTRDRISITYDEHAYWMSFLDTDDDPEDKEVWITEYNLSDNFSFDDGEDTYNNEDVLDNYISSLPNTFTHAAMLQNWFLWNVKANYNTGYRPGFLTRATLQNALGGSNIMLSTNGNKVDQAAIGEISCTGTEEDPYFIRRANYYAAQLWSIISTKHLRYLKSNTTMALSNDNLAPTAFLDVEEQIVYIFYTNVMDYTQWYGIDPGTISYVYHPLGGYYADLGTDITSVVLDADQLYSTAGETDLFDLNGAYTGISCASEILLENRFEIRNLDETINPNVTCPNSFITAEPNGVCVLMPAVSMGYFAIPFEIYPLRAGEIENLYSLFPNPASTFFIINQTNANSEIIPVMKIEIYNINGGLVHTENDVATGKAVDVSQLPVGMYSVVIRTTGQPTEVKSLIKMK